MKKAVFPGSFDPITAGHMDIIKRASMLFDELTVLMQVNSAKSSAFTEAQRFDMLKLSLADMDNVKAETFTGLLADYCKLNSIDVIIKGVRDTRDFEYERQIYHVNEMLSGIETVFLITDSKLSFVSSEVVREMIKYRCPVTGLVTAETEKYINKLDCGGNDGDF